MCMCLCKRHRDRDTERVSISPGIALPSVKLLLAIVPVGSLVKNPPAMQEPQVRSLGQEDPLEKGMATHSSILAWIILRTRGAWQAIVQWVAKWWTRLSN